MERETHNWGAMAPTQHMTRLSDACICAVRWQKYFPFHLPWPFTPSECHWVASQGTLARLAWTSDPPRNPRTSNPQRFFLPGWSPPPWDSVRRRKMNCQIQFRSARKGKGSLNPAPRFYVQNKARSALPSSSPETAALSISPCIVQVQRRQS